MRGISLFPTTLSPNGRMRRVIGTTDFTGAGIRHGVAEVNPFILLDDAAATVEPGLPAFGMHPHHGCQVASLIWEGLEFMQLGHEAEPVAIPPGPVVVSVHAGRGMVHDERSQSSERTQLEQLFWLVPESSRTRPVRIEVNRSGFIQAAPGARVFVAVGRMFGVDSGITTDTPVNVLMGLLEPGASLELPTMQGGGFVYGLTGPLVVDATNVPMQTLAELASADGSVTVRSAAVDGEVRFLFANGARIDEPWTKLLVHSGFVITRDEAEARRQEALFKEQGLARYGQAPE